jgi:hypothetical protein
VFGREAVAKRIRGRPQADVDALFFSSMVFSKRESMARQLIAHNRFIIKSRFRFQMSEQHKQDMPNFMRFF